MYDRVLVPTDGSERAYAAVEHAVDLAKRYEARLHAVYVVDVRGSEFAPGKASLWDPVVDSVRNRGNEHTGRIAEEASRAGLEAQQAVVEAGTAAEGILSYADEHDVDLIVIGTRGRSGPKRWLLGSVTEGVVRGSDVPVLCIPPSGSED